MGGHEVSEEYGKAYWEQRYQGHGQAHDHGHHHGHGDGGGHGDGHGNGHTREWEPNGQLMAEVADLAPGTALEAGCGTGTNAAWLSSRGWRVTAVDISDNALAQARERTSDVDWRQADLTVWTPEPERFDLVYSLYVHTTGSREELFAKLAAAVAPGGTLLVVDHHSDVDSMLLDPATWEIVTNESREWQWRNHGGHATQLHDTVLRARRR